MKHFIYTPVLILVLFVLLLGAFEFHHGRKNYYTIMENRAEEILNTVIEFREWMSDIEVLYGNAEQVAPNPYLMWRNDRDISAGGLHLTLINPAYMTKLLSERLNRNSSITLRLFGPDPINPENIPLPWEIEGLKSIKNGADHYSQPRTESYKEMSYRYMKPLYAKDICISCHYLHGIDEGDLMGGISVELPAGEVSAMLFRATVKNVIMYTFAAVFIVTVVIFFQRRILRLSSKQKETIGSLNKAIHMREMSEKALMRQIRVSSQGNLLSLVSHHWRQPLNSVSLILDLVKEQLKDNNMENIHEITEAQKMLQDLSSSIEVFKGQYVSEPKEDTFSVTHAVIEAAGAIAPVLQSLNIKLWMKCGTICGSEDLCICTSQMREEGDCPHNHMKLTGSRSDFHQILLAMIKNAYEAIQEKKIEDPEFTNGLISIDTVFYDGFADITVKDNGTGITYKTAEKAFDPYFTTKGYDSGRGTGLYLAKTLSEKFREGRITLNSSGNFTEAVFSAKLESWIGNTCG